ncbi:MAG: PKD domain-containing protein [Bacteroidales bacterium]|nr:PKD domain-containing protein [Bacteroidales bacterium]
MSKKLRIEDLLQSSLEGAELTPSPESWRAIQHKLRWPQFLRFRPGSFNIYYAGALLLAAGAVVLLLAGLKSRTGTELPEEHLPVLVPAEETAGDRQAEIPREESHNMGPAGTDPDTSSRASQAEEDPAQPEESPDPVARVEEKVPEALQKSGVLAETASFDPAPLSYFTTSIQTGCAPLTVQFTNQSVHATSFYWDFGTGETSREENPVYEFKKAGRYLVSLTSDKDGTYPAVSRSLVEVLESPVADFRIEEGMEGIDNHVVLNLVNYSSDASAFAWNLVDKESADCSRWSSVEYQPTLQLNTITPDSRAVKLEVINENGCSDTAVQPLPLVVQSSETRIKFATAFSPNPSGPGDGSFAPGSRRIDLFHPIYIEVPVEYRMRIYTRRGELIFETREVYRGWDGYLHQEAAPADVYVWMVDGRWADGEPFSMHGDVTLIRNSYW